MNLTKEQLLKRGSGKITQLKMPDGGESVYIKAIPASFLVGFDKKTAEDTDGAAAICASVCDKNGNLLLNAATDREAVLALPWDDFHFLSREIQIFSGLAKREKEEADTAEKN